MLKKFLGLLVLLGALALVSLAAAAPVLADGPSREITPSERQFAEKLIAAIEQALPPGPDGWDEGERNGDSAPDRVGEGAEEYPFSWNYRISWRDSVRLEEAQRNFDAKAQQMVPDPAQQAASEAMIQEYGKLAEAIGAAAGRGDTSEVERLQKEAEAMAARLTAHGAQQDQAIQQLIADTTPHDVNVDIHVEVNYFDVNLTSDEPAVGPKVPDAAFCLRQQGGQDPNRGWQEGITYILFGNWKRVPDASVTSLAVTPKAGAPHTTVQTIIIRVQADEARADHLIKQFNWNALTGLLNK